MGAKNVLGGGEDWGAHLVLEYISNPMMLVQAVKDVTNEDGEVVGEENIEGAYYIETFRPNGDLGSMDFMGWNGYIDCPMAGNTWELIPVEGKPNVYNIAQYGQTFPIETVTDEEGNEKTEYVYDVYEVSDARDPHKVKNEGIENEHPFGDETKILRKTLAKVLKAQGKYDDADYAEFKQYNEFAESV